MKALRAPKYRREPREQNKWNLVMSYGWVLVERQKTAAHPELWKESSLDCSHMRARAHDSIINLRLRPQDFDV